MALENEDAAAAAAAAAAGSSSDSSIKKKLAKTSASSNETVEKTGDHAKKPKALPQRDLNASSNSSMSDSSSRSESSKASKDPRKRFMVRKAADDSEEKNEKVAAKKKLKAASSSNSKDAPSQKTALKVESTSAPKASAGTSASVKISKKKSPKASFRTAEGAGNVVVPRKATAVISKKIKKLKQAPSTAGTKPSPPHKKTIPKKSKLPVATKKSTKLHQKDLLSTSEAAARSVVAAAVAETGDDEDSDSSAKHEATKSNATASSSTHKSTRIPYDKMKISASDVLLGRGKRATLWKGNINYKKLICAYVPAYEAAGKNKDKTIITIRIVDHVRMLGGRFLKEDTKTGELTPVSDLTARLKVGQALRHRMRQDGVGEDLADQASAYAAAAAAAEDDHTSVDSTHMSHHSRSLSKQNERAYAKIIGEQQARKSAAARGDVIDLEGGAAAASTAGAATGTGGNLDVLLEALKYDGSKDGGSGQPAPPAPVIKKRPKLAKRRDSKMSPKEALLAEAQKKASTETSSTHISAATQEDLSRAAIEHHLLQQDPRHRIAVVGSLPPQTLDDIAQANYLQASQEVALQQMLLKKEIARRQAEQALLAGESEDVSSRSERSRSLQGMGLHQLHQPGAGQESSAAGTSANLQELLQKLPPHEALAAHQSQQMALRAAAFERDAALRAYHASLLGISGEQHAGAVSEQAKLSEEEKKTLLVEQILRQQSAQESMNHYAIMAQLSQREMAAAEVASNPLLEAAMAEQLASHQQLQALHLHQPAYIQHQQSLKEDGDSTVANAIKNAAKHERAQQIREHYRKIQELEMAERQEDVDLSVASAMQKYATQPGGVASKSQDELLQQALDEQTRKLQAEANHPILGAFGGASRLAVLEQQKKRDEAELLAGLARRDAHAAAAVAGNPYLASVDALKQLYPQYFGEQDGGTKEATLPEAMTAAAGLQGNESKTGHQEIKTPPGTNLFQAGLYGTVAKTAKDSRRKKRSLNEDGGVTNDHMDRKPAAKIPKEDEASLEAASAEKKSKEAKNGDKKKMPSRASTELDDTGYASSSSTDTESS
eukprot:CAMPEP_0172444390 /NCGR_PEP_ID=MMETSP1065-20121228/4443_1 /TAXON_ID=265537 /ORGANISM="Amphiprora paludosa, Strain CCMP125" /LENGTH=1063 /DNA_ID=CAMNT_0013194911 /DNA_START=112 /DNA_END=3303 /DNA_ORIENTATION=+